MKQCCHLCCLNAQFKKNDGVRPVCSTAPGRFATEKTVAAPLRPFFSISPRRFAIKKTGLTPLKLGRKREKRWGQTRLFNGTWTLCDGKNGRRTPQAIFFNVSSSFCNQKNGSDPIEMRRFAIKKTGLTPLK
jgi:hypothetical protein